MTHIEYINKFTEGTKKIYYKYLKKYSIFFIILIFFVTLLIILELKNAKTGNTIGNIRNYGYSASDGKWIYYLCPNEQHTEIGIYRERSNGTNKEELMMTNMDIRSINYYKGYLYFIGIGDDGNVLDSENTNELEDDNVNNKIYRIKADGSSEKEIINDNEFYDKCYDIYVIKNHIYYIGVDLNIYKMNLDGSNRKLVSDTGTGYLAINNKYIVYDVNEKLEGSEDVKTVTYIMKLNGKNKKTIIEDQKLDNVNIDGNTIYYTDVNRKIFKTRIGSNKGKLLYDTSAYNLNLYKNYLYYIGAEYNSKKLCVYKIKINGTPNSCQKIATFETYSYFINIVNDKVIFMDSNDSFGYMKCVNLDGSNEIKLYELNKNNIEK